MREIDRGEHSASIDYTVRVSLKARRVRLVMKPEGLEVVVPRGYGRQHIPELLESHQAWIDRASKHVEERRRRLAEDPPRLPDQVELRALGEIWPVDYRQSGNGASGARLRVRGDRLVVLGDEGDFDGCRKALLRWLNRRAREELVPRLAELAHRHDFRYSKVTVRQQRTRWGSCSPKRNISLNARLLLLPSAACEYVLLHELCHTVHLNHSASFWALMERHDPAYKSHKRLVRESAKSLPTWLDNEPSEATK